MLELVGWTAIATTEDGAGAIGTVPETVVQVAQRNKKLTSVQRNELSWLRILFKNRRAYVNLLAEDEEHPSAFALEAEYSRIMKHLCDSGLFLTTVGV